jgi:signal transduction histidine kinase
MADGRSGVRPSRRVPLRLRLVLGFVAAALIVLAGSVAWPHPQRMLAAEESAAQRQQQFVDDASHEPRTPLTVLTG